NSGKEWTTFRLQRPADVSIKGYGSHLRWRAAGELCFLGEEKARVRLWSVSDIGGGKQGEARVLTPGDFVVESMTVVGDHLAVVMNDTSHLTEVYLVEEDKLKQLTHRNPQVDSWKLPRISIFAWKGAKGDMVEGVLELPPDYKKGQKVPL